MLFFAGVFLCIISVIMLIRFIRNSKRPRINDARILEVTHEPYEYMSNLSQRKMPHAKVEYFHQSVRHEKKILLKSKSKDGDIISLSINGNDPAHAEQFYPAKEVIAMILVTALGVSLILASLVLTNYLY